MYSVNMVFPIIFVFVSDRITSRVAVPFGPRGKDQREKKLTTRRAIAAATAVCQGAK